MAWLACLLVFAPVVQLTYSLQPVVADWNDHIVSMEQSEHNQTLKVHQVSALNRNRISEDISSDSVLSEGSKMESDSKNGNIVKWISSLDIREWLIDTFNGSDASHNMSYYVRMASIYGMGVALAWLFFVYIDYSCNKEADEEDSGDKITIPNYLPVRGNRRSSRSIKLQLPSPKDRHCRF
mmetsp:Transcript_5232/g.7696  ORF Transcript_5232/g.7696 Transcript_5232/m.7696 type:complete len:181 (+) Transcript_5232:53-595(+)|eukprot:CAMPEP_0167765342 /NCGR_PEP_ID=MMETSP0110_2-20121227/14622_1 /TAXON_ID=629695 /ORGANISM="Gymnochlora sp., Strain CCMP2014" /LENGTH=180 /DNA_ID=CAMNT_0007653021 /DNA_START=343 /DNA_END=885 /DNA_ORIENTATION=-